MDEGQKYRGASPRLSNNKELSPRSRPRSNQSYRFGLWAVAVLKQGTTIHGILYASKPNCHNVAYSWTVNYSHLLSAAVAYPALPQRNTFIAANGNWP
jgi:hypothetical protein